MMSATLSTKDVISAGMRTWKSKLFNCKCEVMTQRTSPMSLRFSEFSGSTGSLATVEHLIFKKNIIMLNVINCRLTQHFRLSPPPSFPGLDNYKELLRVGKGQRINKTVKKSNSRADLPFIARPSSDDGAASVSLSIVVFQWAA